MRENVETREKNEEKFVKTDLAAAKIPFKTIFAGGETALAGGVRMIFFFTCKTNKSKKIN